MSENKRKGADRKYLNLPRKLTKLLNIEETMIPISVGVPGTVSKNLENCYGDIPHGVHAWTLPDSINSD